MKYQIDIPDMNCGHCGSKIEVALSGLDATVNVDLESKSIEVESENPSGEILAALENAGYPGSVRE